MAPVPFQTLPTLLAFVPAVVVAQMGVTLFTTGRRFLKQVSAAAVGFVGAVLGETIGINLFPFAPWVGMIIGLAGGTAIGYSLRPVGVGLALAYVGYSVAGNLIPLEYAQYVAALVLFSYGLLLTDLAPTFVASFLASSLLLLLGVWAGIPTQAALVLSLAGGASRIMASVLPTRLAMRSERPAVEG